MPTLAIISGLNAFGMPSGSVCLMPSCRKADELLGSVREAGLDISYQAVGRWVFMLGHAHAGIHIRTEIDHAQQQ